MQPGLNTRPWYGSYCCWVSVYIEAVLETLQRMSCDEPPDSWLSVVDGIVCWLYVVAHRNLIVRGIFGMH